MLARIYKENLSKFDCKKALPWPQIQGNLAYKSRLQTQKFHLRGKYYNPCFFLSEYLGEYFELMS